MQTIEDLKAYTFPALLANSVAKFGKCKSLSFVNGTPMTYEELYSFSETIARQLFSFAIKAGCRVAIFATSSPNWGASFLGIVDHGCVAVPMLPDFNAEEVKAILTHAQVSCVLVSGKLKDKVLALDEAIAPVVINIDDFSVLRGEPVMNADDVVLPECTINEEDTASIIYTSGTTGRSKGVELTHKNLVWTAVHCQSVHRVSFRDRCLSFLPMSHVYEFTIGFVMQILNGASIYYLGRPPTVSALLPAFKKVRPTIVLSVPLVMEKIYKNKVLPTFTKSEFVKKLYGIRFFQKMLHRIAGGSLKKTFGGHITFFGVGGAKMDTVVEQFLKDAHFPYAIGYGLTETSPLLAGSGPRITIPGTVGPAMAGVTLAISNPDPVTGVGEVVSKGENVMKGYYKDPELTAKAFTTEDDDVGAGWFKTGDLGLIENGRLALKGRLKNMILGASGENIYPEDIEFVLNQHPFVLESLVVEDADGLVAIVQLDEEKIQDVIMNTVKDFAENAAYQYESVLNEIQFFVNQKVNRISHVNKVQRIDAFEKTASQKIKRYLYNFTKGSETDKK